MSLKEKTDRDFFPSELETYDGKAGRPVYVAYKDKVYDVSTSRRWKQGIHASYHSAGQDLTDKIQYAPHRDRVLFRFPVVGRLVDEDPD